MTYKIACNLVREDINTMTLEQVQKHRVKLIDAFRCSKGDYGFNQGVIDGFFKIIASESSNGYTPTDAWLFKNICSRLDECDERERMLLNK